MTRPDKLRVAVAIAALACGSALRAHHSSSLFDFARPEWVTGTVVSYVPGNPHTMIVLEVRNGRGELERANIEGPILARLRRMSLPADFLRAGDVIEICAFPYRNRGSAPALHGHLIVLRDGRRQPWSPYGKLDNCIRSGDAIEPWLELIDREPMAHEYWCNSRAASYATSLAPIGVVDEIDRRLAKPCR